MKKIKAIKKISKYILFIIVMFASINGVSALYNGGSASNSPGVTASGCGKWMYQNAFCQFNNTHHNTIKISLYYFNKDGSRELIGNPKYVTNNLSAVLYVVPNRTDLIEDKSVSLNHTVLKNYFETKDVALRYLGLMNVDYNWLNKESLRAAGYERYGYRFVIEPCWTGYRNGMSYLLTAKEIAQFGLTAMRQMPIISKTLYLQWDDVGIRAPSNPMAGTSNLEEVRDERKGWGYNIIDVFAEGQLVPPVRTCDPNNPEDFSTPTSGPNGEDCCECILNDLTKYGMTKEQLFEKYPRCKKDYEKKYYEQILKTCKFNLTTSYPTCSNNAYGRISDINNWDCIRASAYSTDSSVKNYFLKYGSIDSQCSVYCRDEIEYFFPGNDMFVLAGNYFSIADKTNSYFFYTDAATSQYKVRAATLGPVKTSVTRECTIVGNNDGTCQIKLNEQLDNLKAQEIEFGYESAYYNNPVENLKVRKTTSSKTTKDNIQSKRVTFEYALPDSTYKYVSKGTGASHKNLSSIGKYPYITIGNHAPVHFTQSNGKTEYQLAIKKFNLKNFDDAIIQGKKLSTTFVTSIETYIQTLINSGSANPTNINGRWYLDNSFIKLLQKNNYDTSSFFKMTCSNTDSYACYSDGNGIYCLDKNSNSNSEQTYKNFNNCIKQNVQKLKSDKKSYKNDMLYSCTFYVNNSIIPRPGEVDPDPDCVGDDCPKPGPNNPDNPDNPDDCVGANCPKPGDGPDSPGGINVIFRPISLDNPFPSIDGDGRTTGSNWCYWGNNEYSCANTNNIVKKAITNNRNVTTEKVYKDLGPLYKITLTPALIKEIRAYNKKTSYDDFNLKCTNGTKCLSDFIRTTFKNDFTGCGIKGNEGTTKCQDFDRWG